MEEMQSFSITEASSFTPNDRSLAHWYDTWNTFGGGTDQTLGRPLYLSDQSNHAGKLSCSQIRRDSARDGSIPVEDLMSEILWPQQQSNSPRNEPPQPLILQEASQLVLRDIEASEEEPHHTVEVCSSVSPPIVNPEPPKRKRGRPRLHPSPSPTSAHTSFLSSGTTLDLRRAQLEANRVSAAKCRRRKKEQHSELLADYAVLSSQNEALKAEKAAYSEELLRLKGEILQHAGCGSSVIERYIQMAAGNHLEAQATSAQRKNSCNESFSSSSDSDQGDPGDQGDFTSPSSGRKPSSGVDTDAEDLFDLLADFMDTDKP